MAQTVSEITESLAEEMSDMEQVSQAEHFGRNEISVTLDRALSSSRLDRMLPDGWRTEVVMGAARNSTVVVIED